MATSRLIERMESRMIVRLVTTGEDEATRKARAALDSLPNAQVQVVYCPRSVADWFECPFVRDDGGREYFGLAGIKYFVSQRLGGRVVS
jgi:hypothetical protein